MCARRALDSSARKTYPLTIWVISEMISALFPSSSSPDTHRGKGVTRVVKTLYNLFDVKTVFTALLALSCFAPIFPFPFVRFLSRTYTAPTFLIQTFHPVKKRYSVAKRLTRLALQAYSQLPSFCLSYLGQILLRDA